jgi:hypothetical protein
VDARHKAGHDELIAMRRGAAAPRLLAVALEYLLTGRTQFLAILLQALLDRRIVAHLFSAKARSVARTRLLFLGSPLSALGKSQ